MKEFKEKIEQLRKKQDSLYFTVNALDNVYLYLLDRQRKGTLDKTDEIVLNTFTGLSEKYLKNPEAVNIDELAKAKNELYGNLRKELTSEAQQEVVQENKNKSGIYKFFDSIFTQMGIGALICAGIGGLLIFAGAPWFAPLIGALIGALAVGYASARSKIESPDPIREKYDQKYSFWAQSSGEGKVNEAFENMIKDTQGSSYKNDGNLTSEINLEPVYTTFNPS